MALGRARRVATVAISCCSCLLQLLGVFATCSYYFALRKLASYLVYRVVLNGTFRTFWRAVACLAVLDALATLVRMT